MSVYGDMARDGGYRGDEAEQVAAMLEQRHRDERELRAPTEPCACRVFCGDVPEETGGTCKMLRSLP